MKKYLVTGGAGFIGGHLVNELIRRGYKVAVIDDLSSGKKENINPRAKFHRVDICDFKKIKSIFEGVGGVFHLAAIPRVSVSVQDPILTSRVNILGAINVFKAAADVGARRVVFASSSSVYGLQKELPLKETMTPAPISPYGLQKLTGEQFAKMFTNLYNIPVISLRYFNVYGPGIDFNSDYSLVLGKFLRLKSEGRPLTIYGDGEQTRAFCYVEDVINATVAAMESDELIGGEIINVGQKISYSINYLAKLIGGEVQYLPKRAADPLRAQADIAAAKKLLNWEPKVDFNKGVEITKKWFQNNAKI